MKKANNDYHEALRAARLYSSSEVKYLLGINSDTTLIKMEKNGIIKIKARIGNQKRYCPKHIQSVIDRGLS